MNRAETDAAVDDVDRARAGDTTAFERLLRTHDDRMRAVAFRMLGSGPAMDDALQDAYLRAFRAIGRFRRESEFSTWLYRIVTSTCIDHGRRRGRRREDALPEDDARGDPAVDRVGEVVVRRADLGAALAELSTDHRATLLLVDGEGLSYEEASVVLGVAVGTVASRLARARATMRGLLGEDR